MDTSGLTSALLRLYESRRTVDANYQTSCDLGVKGTAVARLFNT